MKKHIKPVSLAIVFLAGIAMISVAAHTPSASQYPFSIVPPAESFDTSDLDMRDANNKPIKSVSAQIHFENLFISNLTSLLMSSMTPQKRSFLAMMNQAWDLFSGWLRRPIGQILFAVAVWIQKKSWYQFVVSCVGLSLPVKTGPPQIGYQRLNTSFIFHLSPIIASTNLRR